VAPFTDGHGCLQNHADYDGNAANGCEAAPDLVDGERLGPSLVANLVPADDTDRYPFHVDDQFQWDCSGQVKVTLTAPAGVAMRVDVVSDGKVVGTAVSTNAKPATVTMKEAECPGDDAADFEARVRWEGTARSGVNYQLERSGSF
jgi:eukaryotic-like serine/threonine-protein kinase